MRRYQFPLASVLRVRRAQEDLAGAALLRANLEVAARVEALDGAKLHHEQRPGLGGSLSAPTFGARQWRGDRSAAAVRDAEGRRDASVRCADAARAAWADAARRVTVLERLDERRRAEHGVLAERAAERELDDIVVGRFGETTVTIVDDISSGLAAIQSRVASLSSGALPPDISGQFSSILASLSPSGQAPPDLGLVAPSAPAPAPAPLTGAALAGTGGTPAPLTGAALAGTAGAGGTAGMAGLDSLVGGGASSPTGDAVVADASQYIGVPYKWGGSDPAVGLDCSGLVQLTYKDLGITLPRGAADQARMGTPVDGLAQAQPGDLVAFGTPVEHIGIYAGNGMMVVAPHTGANVRLERISVTPSAIRRIVPGPSATFASALSGLAGSPSGLSTGLPSGLDAGSLAGSLSGFDAGSPSGPIGPGLASGPYAGLFNAAGARYGVDPRVLSAVAHAESGYTPTAQSGAGAEGLMQLMPSTAASLGVDPLDPAQAVDGAARLLAGHLQRFGNLPDALAAYNAGGGAVARYGGIPPYPETQAYVRRVLTYVSQEGA